jgi:hypothetical protein
MTFDADKLRALDEAARRPGPAQHFRAALLKGELVSMVPAILAMAEANLRLREALEPFAECCDQIADTEDGEEWAKFRLLIKHYRAARRALGKGKA